MHLFAEMSTFTLYLYGWHLKVLGNQVAVLSVLEHFSKQGHVTLGLLNVWIILTVINKN